MATPIPAIGPLRPVEGPLSTDGILPHPAWLGLMAGVLLWLSFPPAEWAGSAWVALAPLFLLVDSRASKLRVYLGAWLGGFVFWLLAIHWVWWTDESAWLGWLVMAGFLSVWWPAFLFSARIARRRLGLPLILVAPVVWVALEFVRAFVLTGFPWYYLAHSQFRLIYLTQIADFSGALGLSFLIAVVNAFWVDLATLPLFRTKAAGSVWVRLAPAQKRRLMLVGLGLIGTLAYGSARIATARFREGPRVALLQSSDVLRINQERPREQIVAQMEGMVASALSAKDRPDLIVWPETSYPWGYPIFQPGLPIATLDRLVKEIDPAYIPADWTLKRERVGGYFESLMRATGVPIVLGSTIYEFQDQGYFKFNSALLLRPGLAVQAYRKMHLVPFGEYVPLLKALPWLIRLTPFEGDRLHFLDHGPRPEWFELGPYRLAPLICFEDTVPHLVRRFFAEAPGGHQPDLLVNLSNDGWFHETSEHEMHLAVSVFRCIENRVPMVRAVNTGVSAIIDGNGRIVQSMAKLKTGVLAGVTPLDDRTSLYTAWGDWVGLSCLASTIGLILLGTFSPRRSTGDRSAVLDPA